MCVCVYWLNLQVLAVELDMIPVKLVMVKFTGVVSGVGHVLSGFGNG